MLIKKYQIQVVQLLTATALNTKLSKVGNKILDHAKYITTQKLTS